MNLGVEFQNRGFFICLEGIDGCGTTTHSALLHKRFCESGHNSRIIRHPTGEDIGTLIRQILSSPTKKWMFGGDIMARLFSADLLYSWRTSIQPALQSNCVVIADRFTMSTECYQLAEGANKDFISTLLADIPEPDLTIVIDVPVDVCLRRVVARGKKLDVYEEETFQRIVHDNYIAQAKRTKGWVRVIVDGNDDMYTVEERIWNVVQNFLHREEHGLESTGNMQTT